MKRLFWLPILLILVAASCPPPPPPPTAKAVWGMIPTGIGGDVALVQTAMLESRRIGAGVLYWFFSWPEAISPGADFIMPLLKAGGDTAVSLNIINSTVLSPYPPPWRSFDEPGFAEAFAQMAAAFAAKHHPTYIFVGNEVNAYLRTHSGQVTAFETVLKKTTAAVHAAAPQTKVGVVIAFAEDQIALFTRLAASVDMVGYTVYGHGANFSFGNPTDGLAALQRLESVPIGKPFSVLETGWNSSPVLESSEEEQAAFAQLFFDHLKVTKARFLTWYLFQDGVDCTQAALSFFPPGTTPDPVLLERFKAFLCDMGLRRKDNSTKPAWAVFEARGRQ